MFKLKPKKFQENEDLQDLTDQTVNSSKKKKSKKDQKEKPLDPKLKEQIHVMPQRFYVKQKKKRTGLIIIIVVGVLLIGGLGGVAIYLALNLNKVSTEPATNTNQPAPVNQNSNVNQNVNINSNVNTNADSDLGNATTTEANVNLNINSNSNVNLNQNINTNVNVNQPPEPTTVTPLPSAPDTDSDGLTLAEESLYGTNPELADSDGDGFTDGGELLNGYDPTRPGATLTESGIFTTYTHKLYSITFPKSWSLREQGATKDEVLFVGSTGEFIEVLVIPNSNNLSLTNWYQQQFPEIDIKQTTAVVINNFTGLRHPDERSYYLVADQADGNIYLLTYNVGGFSMTNFVTTFQTMVKSFSHF